MQDAQVSPASHASLDALSRRVLLSSVDVGWTSVLVERHIVRPSFEEITPLPTPDQTVVVMTHGLQEIEVLDRRAARRALYRPGSVGLTAGGEAERLRRRPRAGFPTVEKVNIYLPHGTIREAVEHLRRPGQRAAHARLNTLARHDEVLASFAMSLARAAAAGAPELYASTAAHWLAVHLLAADGSWAERQEQDRPSTASRARLASVVDLMRAAYAEPLTLDRLAAEAGVSKFHFTRVFRAAFGSSPHAYLMQVRLGVAKDLLVQTDLDIAKVARSCGFASAAHFGTAFAARVGTSPTAYRRSARGDGRPAPAG